MCTMSADPAGLNCLIVFEKQSCKGSVAKVVKILEKIKQEITFYFDYHPEVISLLQFLKTRVRDG